MSVKEYSLQLSPEIENQAIQKLKEVRNLLTFLVDLPVEERKRLAKLSRKNVGFVDRGLLHAKNHVQYVPPYINAADFSNAVALKESLERVYEEVKALHKSFRDTFMLLSAEIYTAARVFYKSVKAAAKEGGADAERVARDLAYHYKRKPSEEKEGESGEAEAVEG